MAQNIALWGYGFNGKDTEAAIVRLYSDQLRITAIFDSRFGELQRSEYGTPVRDPAEIGDCYRQGLFDSVMITVHDREQKSAISSLLAVHGIPVYEEAEEVSNRSLFRTPDHFPRGRAGFSWQGQAGYGFHVLRDMRMAFVRSSYTAFLFGENGCILSSQWLNQHFWDDVPYLTLFVPPVEKETVFLPGEWCFLAKVWSANYWHFTYESMDQMWLLEKSGYTGRYILPKTSYSPELIALLGIDPERISWREDFDRDTVYQFETLVCTELLRDDRRKSAPVLLEMSEHILSRLPPVEREYPRRVFVRRIGTRKLLLDEKSEALLDKLGFETIVPEDLSVLEQILYFNRADIVFSPHGANSTNSLYMRPGTAFIEAFPYGYVNPCCIETSYRSGLYYLPVVEPQDRSRPIGQNAPFRDYKLPPQLLEMTVLNAVRLTE